MASKHTQTMQSVASILTDTVGFLDTYVLIGAASALADYIEAQVAAGVRDLTPATPRMEYSHDALVALAVENAGIVAYVADSRKINAIKDLRGLTHCGLKAAKDAVEDSRMETAAALHTLRVKLTGNPWDHHHEQDEPPF